MTLSRQVAEQLTRVDAEAAEVTQTEAMAGRQAVLDERSVPIHGLASMEMTADWKDLRDVDQTLSLVAAKLKDTVGGEHESLRVHHTLPTLRPRPHHPPPPRRPHL